MYQQLAHFEIMRRRYREATVLLRRAVEVQPDLWAAHAELGSNLLRLGLIDEARTHLQAAYSGDPYSPTTVNSLRLLDRIDDSRTQRKSGRRSARTTTKFACGCIRKKPKCCAPYALDLTRRSIASFSQRYGFKLREPVTVELYPDHDDFAVRVAALPGIGLLGVTFGYVVAMDSPSGRATGDFHWGSTLWHEMAHVFTLEVTDHSVPRWLSEGISVFEEWRTGPTPGVAVPPDAIAALDKKQFLPIAELDSGFIRPSYPNQVQVSYMQSGLVCLFIEQRWGFEQLAALLRQFDRNAPLPRPSKRRSRSRRRPSTRSSILSCARASPTCSPTSKNGRRNSRSRAPGDSERTLGRRDRAGASRGRAVSGEHRRGQRASAAGARRSTSSNRRPDAIAALEDYRRAGGWDPAALRELARWLDEAGRARAGDRSADCRSTTPIL